MTTETSPDARVVPSRRPQRRLDILLAVGTGGALGTLGRHELALAIPTRAGEFPWDVFTANVVGAFVLGVVMTLVLERLPPTRYVRPFAGIGLCGGLTTFSSWMLDDVLLADSGHTGVAVVYLAVSLLAGLAGLLLGMVAVRALSTERA